MNSETDLNDRLVGISVNDYVSFGACWRFLPNPEL